MKTEIEVKFLNVDIEDVRGRLKDAGAELEQPMRLMRRAIFHNEFMQTGKDAFLRVRDEGEKATMTYKQFNDDSLSGTKEIEVVISDFDDTLAILEQSGTPVASFQESKRELWVLDGVEVMIDEWPWIAPYIEIEGQSEAAVEAVAVKLGYSMEGGVFGHVDKAYEMQYEFLEGVRGVIDIKEVRFDAPIPEQFKRKL